jgi:two-component system chemotaxis response regulator CheY
MPTIMVVDDSVTIRQVASLSLREGGYEVIEAVDGRDALDKLRTRRVDLLLTDLYMPRMNGIELAKEVRASVVNRFTPILVLTTESKDALKTEGKAAGVTGWFVKPFEPGQLLKVIRKLLG